ncbi:hypothetical protein GCM10023323_64100 [Streptomyces thinghirensis]|uniref:Uncharacterized protein n=1 Tax=Streptomyces thinghirensis TaxID=551547 RepID=A0ABP9TCI2_9ACTN
MTETDSAISGGSVRDVLADTNNLSERWKTASGPVHDGQEPTAGLGVGRRRGRAGEMHSAMNGVRIPSAAVTS